MIQPARCLRPRGRARWVRACATATVVAFALTASGCATMIHGTTTDLKNTTTPPGAVIEVYRWKGEQIAGPSPSPGEVEVHRPVRHEPYLIRVSSPGYCPQYTLTTSPTTGGSWLYLWMLFVPALGPILVAATAGAIDGATGGCCGVHPDAYTAHLAEDYACPESPSSPSTR